MTAPDLRALAEAAPRGPWSFWVSKGNGDRYVLTKDGTAMAMMVRGSNTNPEPVGRYLTAVSPDVILALLDEIDALRDVAETALFPAVIPRMRKAPAQLDGTPGPS